MKRLILAIILVLFISTPVSATYFIDGYQLVRGWQEYQKLQAKQEDRITSLTGHYIGYVSGIADVLNKIAFRVPANTKLSELCAVVGKYIDNHPSEWNYEAKTLVIKALMQEYPIK